MRSFIMLFGLLAMLLAACGKPTKSELLRKAEGAGSKAELEALLGPPDDVDKVGPLERWTYEARNGSVIFLIAGDTVTFELTSED